MGAIEVILITFSEVQSELLIPIKQHIFKILRLLLPKEVSNMALFSPLQISQAWVTVWLMHHWISVQKSQDVDMKLFERESGALTHWPTSGGEIRQCKNPYYPLLIGVSHKFSAVFTKQAARATSCVCVSQILLMMSGLNQPGPIPRPLTSNRPLAEI